MSTTAKKILIGLGIVVAIGWFINIASTPATTKSVPVESSAYATQTATTVPVSPAQRQAPLSNNNYYTNTVGNKVHAPAYGNVVPVGASARCRDNTYSFSQSRSGTCSHHGGVASWL